MKITQKKIQGVFLLIRVHCAALGGSFHKLPTDGATLQFKLLVQLSKVMLILMNLSGGAKQSKRHIQTTILYCNHR